MKFLKLAFLLPFFFAGSLIFAQQEIEGIVLDYDETPLSSIIVKSGKDSFNLAVTDQNGKFIINVNDDLDNIIFDGSLHGYANIVLPLNEFLKSGIVRFDNNNIQGEYTFNPLTIYSNWTKRKEPFTAQNINQKELNKYNFGNDLPTLLQFETSVVHTSDAGAGVGYTGLRIRGSDQTRINVTINGVPVNDSESQGVFWVNISDIAASTEQLQIQRGVGPSTNGVGSFGASINLNTLSNRPEPGLELTQTYGSFNTLRTSISANTGSLGKEGRFRFAGRYSKISSDGYIDRATSDLSSFYVEGGYFGERMSSRIVVFGGKEITYQAWNGLPIQWIGDNRTLNTAGLNSDGTTYDDQVDNYYQNHIHWINTAKINENLDFNLTLHYTKGAGFYEEFRENDPFSTYGLNNVIIDTDTINGGDFIRRRWLDNDFVGFVSNINYSRGSVLHTLGGGYNYYEGMHFGEVLWSENGNLPDYKYEYYNNVGKKYDANVFYSMNYPIRENLFGYLDLQYRFVNFDFIGINRELDPLAQVIDLHFINPKVGLTLVPDQGSKYYLSLAVANKEPNRRDYVDASPEDQPLPETLYNVEIGFEKRYSKLSIITNLYGMYYQDQLILNGRINDVGAFTRINVDKSYRAGVEISSTYNLTRGINISGNIALSENKVLDYENYVDVWDDGSQRIETFDKSPIAFSPALVAGLSLGINPASLIGGRSSFLPNSISFDMKYISRQFLDNTGDIARSLGPYSFTNVKIEYLFDIRNTQISLFGSVNNLFNSLYSNNGWVYAFDSAGYNPINDDPSVLGLGGVNYASIGLYPQAGIHFNFGVKFSFR